ncbi:MAG: helix-turn-helix domain-containing protein [Phycisphaerae bacterium]
MDPLFSTIRLRARDLGLTQNEIARMSHVSLPTVKRIFAGKHTAVSFSALGKIATTLGLTISAQPITSAEQLREQRARKKAERLIKQLQATSALEGQALTKEQLDDMVRKTIHELLAGSSRRLWED